MDTTSLPTGTVTFLFTDIEGSTRLWEQHPEAMGAAVARHDALAAAVIAQHRGVLVKSRGEGDSLFAVFAQASDALAAACALQQAVLAEPWPAETPLRVRIALHTAAAELRDGDYYGLGVNRCARLRAVAHGGQVLLSSPTYDRVRDQLPEGAGLRDLGSHRLKDLQQPEQLFQLLHPALPADFPPLRSLAAFAHNLPVQLTRFIGREREMAEVKRLLAASYLLTLTGSGGCGKTRLALQLAADLVEDYAEGVWLVELAALADPALVSQTVVSALGVREEPSRTPAQTLLEYLRPKHLLLVLDNCEHLLAACAQLADTLLRSCPHLRVLASSREGLGVAGEQTYRVPSLSVPDAEHLPSPERLQEFEAVQLFAARAALSQPTFAVTAANAPAVVQVCRRLDGIPLAIELAAARVKALPVEKVAERLDDRLRLLTGGSRTALPRQQTLRALIDWSYDLLTETERTLLRRLSVFAGGWTLEAAEAVCAGEGIEAWEVLDLLAALVEKSQVQYEEPAREARYRLLETVRQYARDRLLEAGEAAGVRERHRDWFLALAEEAEPTLWTNASWLDRLEREHDNLRAALAWSGAQGQGEAGLRLGGALCWFWEGRGYLREGREHLAAMLALPGAEARTAARAKALSGAAFLADRQGDYGAARLLLEEGLAIFRELDHKNGITWLLGWLGVVTCYQGDYGTARALLEEKLATLRPLGNKGGAAWSLINLARAIHGQGDDDRARELFEEAQTLWRELGDKTGEADVCMEQGHLLLELGDHAAARSCYEEGLALRRTGESHPRLIGAALLEVGHAAWLQGEPVDTQSHAVEALGLFQAVGDKEGILAVLESLAVAALAQGRKERAARLLGAVAVLRESLGLPGPGWWRRPKERIGEAVRAASLEQEFAAAWAEGRTMTLDEAGSFALAEEA